MHIRGRLLRKGQVVSDEAECRLTNVGRPGRVKDLQGTLTIPGVVLVDPGEELTVQGEYETVTVMVYRTLSISDGVTTIKVEAQGGPE